MQFTVARMKLPPTPSGVDEVEQALRDALEALRISARALKREGYADWCKAQMELADEIESRAFQKGHSPKVQ